MGAARADIQRQASACGLGFALRYDHDWSAMGVMLDAYAEGAPLYRKLLERMKVAIRYRTLIEQEDLERPSLADWLELPYREGPICRPRAEFVLKNLYEHLSAKPRWGDVGVVWQPSPRAAARFVRRTIEGDGVRAGDRRRRHPPLLERVCEQLRRIFGGQGGRASLAWELGREVLWWRRPTLMALRTAVWETMDGQEYYFEHLPLRSSSRLPCPALAGQCDADLFGPVVDAWEAAGAPAADWEWVHEHLAERGAWPGLAWVMRASAELGWWWALPTMVVCAERPTRIVRDEVGLAERIEWPDVTLRLERGLFVGVGEPPD